jgi:peptidoglycan/LPS O-acetylase OafA/YrhL
MSPPSHANNFSTLRIAFAILVVFSHSSALLSANGDLLTRLSGTISFGVLAVDGFFIVSGYLITKSFLSAPPKTYLTKRILRIYPGFIVAFALSIALCTYVSSHSLAMPKRDIADNLLNLLFLISPSVKPAYPGSLFPICNASLWTISYEFHCYLMILLLGVLGVLKRPKIMLALSAVALLAYAIHPENYVLGDPLSSTSLSADFSTQIIHKLSAITLELPIEDLRFAAIFLAGSCFYLFRNTIPYSAPLAIAATLFLIACLVSNHLAEPALATFGAYLIFWFALHIKPLGVSTIFNKTDLSYGIYLYAWPIQKILLQQLPHITPTELFVLALPPCLIMAFLSWTLIEKPCLSAKQPVMPAQAGISQSKASKQFFL